jgi:anti-sigma factor RsiW
MTLHEEWTDKLSEYLDDELAGHERAAVEAHLAQCRECTAILNDLRRVVWQAHAAAGDISRPRTDLWPGVAGRIERVRQPRRIALTMSQLAAAAVVVAAVSGGLVWRFVPASGPGALRYDTSTPGEGAQALGPANGNGSDAVPDAGVALPVSMADAQYDAAVSDLERALKQGRGRLDASTIAVVEHNLDIIDQAINQAREALAADPANSYLSSHLAEARRRKLDLLRRATALTSDTD